MKNNGQQEAVNELYDWIACRLIVDKKTQEEVISLLIEQGISQVTAARMVADVANEWAEKATKETQSTKTGMIVGGIVFFAGIIGSYLDSIEVYWVAILGGTIVFFRAAIKRNNL